MWVSRRRRGKAGNFTAIADSEFFITVIRLCHKSVQSQLKNTDHLLIFFINLSFFL
jgi:hypothetical protein